MVLTAFEHGCVTLTAIPLTTPPPSAASDGPPRRGGNRLGPDHPYRSWTPSYERRRDLGPSPERHDHNQRTRTRRAMALAQSQGRLPPILAAVLEACCEMSDTTMQPIWPRLATIARRVLGDDHYNDDGTGGERTAGRWMSQLKQLGWFDWENRFVNQPGQVQGTSNLWRVIIPDVLRHTVEAAEDAARARAATGKKTTPTPKAPQNRGTVDHSDNTGKAQRRNIERQGLQRDFPCTAGCDRGWVVPPDNGPVSRCAACDGTGHTPQAPP